MPRSFAFLELEYVLLKNKQGVKIFYKLVCWTKSICWELFIIKFPLAFDLNCKHECRGYEFIIKQIVGFPRSRFVSNHPWDMRMEIIAVKEHPPVIEDKHGDWWEIEFYKDYINSLSME